MFQEWGFLISEMLVLIILAALLGVLVGWIFWGRRKGDAEAAGRLRAELDTCRGDARTCAADLKTVRTELKTATADLDACRAGAAGKDKRIAELERDVEKAEALAEAAEVAAMEAAAESVAVAEAVEADHGLHPVHPGALDASEPAPEPTPEPSPETETKVEGSAEAAMPATLSAARGGSADDLKQIKGIGPKLETLCNDLGFYHFDQIAAWTADEVAWVDANLKGFKGRVSRDSWVAQAKVLAEGGTTEFSNTAK